MAKSALTRAVKIFGTEQTEGRRRTLLAGPLTAVFDNGALRYIRYRGTEVLRGIAYLLRDKDWGTYAPEIENLKIRQGKSGFSVSYTATAKDKDQGLRYTAKIEADASGVLRFSAVGTPLSDFLTNRTGFVVLHPLQGVVGAPVEITHTDGRKERSRFPKLISPGQPVFEIRALKHTVMPGVTATVLMEGNKFEMEDHRNWMDASYKTYVCSLLDPWPYTLKKGEALEQSITVSVSGTPKVGTARRSGGGTVVAVGGPKGRLPVIGAGVPMKEAAAALAKADLVAAARPGELVCLIDGREQGQAKAADAFARLKQATGAPVKLEIVLPCNDSAASEMAAIADAVRSGGLVPDSVVVTQKHDLKSFQPNTQRPWGPGFEEMAAAARAAFPGVPLGGGMLSFFTELNRKRPAQGLFDFVTHSTCPIVHAADDVSVMETLESLPSIIASTRAIIGKSPYHLGPSSIPCRDNPYGAAVAPNPGNGRVCLAAMDPRQRGLFAAAWYVGLAAAAARGGLDSIALGAVIGPQGVIYHKAAHAQPWFDDGAASVYPAYHVLAGLAPAGRSRRLETTVTGPAAVAALAHQAKGGAVLWLANLTGERQAVKVSGLSGPVALHMIDEANFAKAARQADFLARSGSALKRLTALELGPYAVARVAAA